MMLIKEKGGEFTPFNIQPLGSILRSPNSLISWQSSKLRFAAGIAGSPRSSVSSGAQMHNSKRVSQTQSAKKHFGYNMLILKRNVTLSIKIFGTQAQGAKSHLGCNLLIIINSVEGAEFVVSLIRSKCVFKSHLDQSAKFSANHHGFQIRAKRQGSISNATPWQTSSAKYFADVQSLLVTKSNLENHPENNRITNSKPVNQPSFRGEAQCLRGINADAQIQSAKSHSGRNSLYLMQSSELSRVHLPKYLGQPLGSSLSFLRWRRLISPLAAVIRKPAVLSPLFFTASISSNTSCGTRTFTCFDLLFIEPVAITGSPYTRCYSLYAKKNYNQYLTCYSLSDMVNSTLIKLRYKNGNAPDCWSSTEASNHNVKEAYTMAIYHSTQTHPKFLWRFYSIRQNTYHIVPADTEKEARQCLPSGRQLFTARIRQEVSHA